MKQYLNIGGGYFYAVLRGGVALRNRDGHEVYFRPGTAAAAILDTLAALDEVDESKRAVIADMALGDYFHTN